MWRNYIFSNIKVWKSTTLFHKDYYFITLRKKCPNTDQKKLRIWTLFAQYKRSSKDSDQSFSYLLQFLKTFKNTQIISKTNGKCSSRVNVKHKVKL